MHRAGSESFAIPGPAPGRGWGIHLNRTPGATSRAGEQTALVILPAIAGTGRGADTAVVLTPAHAQDLFELKVHEIVCKPRL